MLGLTEQQTAVYTYIRECIIARGYGPTIREIGEHMDIKSPNGVMCHLRALERKGAIHRSANKKRAIELAEPITREGPQWPIHARLTGGIVSLSSEPYSFRCSESLVGRANCFLIEVLDQDFGSDVVQFGDLIVIEPGNLVAPGQIVIADAAFNSKSNKPPTRISQGILARCKATLKEITIQPLNRAQSSLIIHRENIIGIAVSIIRNL